MEESTLPGFSVQNPPNSTRTHVGAGLDIEVTEGSSCQVSLYCQQTLIKSVDLSDSTARRLFIVEAVGRGVKKSKLAKALGISRQTIDNNLDSHAEFGLEGLIYSYHPRQSKSRAKHRNDKQQKLPKGNKARVHEQNRKKTRQEEQPEPQQSLFSEQETEAIQSVATADLPFNEIHDWKATRYAGVFLYLIFLISESKWLEHVSGHFGKAYKIFMVFILMVSHNIPSIEQLKNVHREEAGALLGLGKLRSRPTLWKWFYNAAKMNKSDILLHGFFQYQLATGKVDKQMWFVDGHLLPYTGKSKVHYSYNTQRRMPVPGQTNLVTCDQSGRIVDFDIQEGKGNFRDSIKGLKKWKGVTTNMPLIVFDREGYGAQFFHELIMAAIPFATWDKYVNAAKLANIDDSRFSEEITFNGKEYALFEGKKSFSYEAENSTKNDKQKETFELRRIYIWNKSSNRRTCGLAWSGDSQFSTVDCAKAILSRWGASENTFKHLYDRHPFHYHPGFKLQESKKQDIKNPEIKEKQHLIKSLKTRLARLYKKLTKAKTTTNKDGSIRHNSAKETIKKTIGSVEAEVETAKKEKDKLPETIDVSGLEDYRSFKQIDNEGKNLFDFVTSSVWNARKQMVDWLRQFYKGDNEVVDLFYAITKCHGWVKSGKTDVVVRLEPLQQSKRRAAQEQLCRKLSALGARLPSGKLLTIEVGNTPLKMSNK